MRLEPLPTQLEWWCGAGCMVKINGDEIVECMKKTEGNHNMQRLSTRELVGRGLNVLSDGTENIADSFAVESPFKEGTHEGNKYQKCG